MTNQEAISYLCNLRVAIGRTEHQALWHYEHPLAEIVDMLSEETHDKRTETHACVCERTETHDLISRKAAIEAVGFYSVHSGDDLLFADKPLKDLPSAEPESSSCWHENDLINRQAAIDAVNSLTYPSSLMDVKRKIIELPSAEPEIIHCRDCEYGESDQDGWWYCTNFGGQVGESDGSGYCADAEKRRR